MDWEQGNGKLWEVDLSALRVGSVVVLWERVEGDVRPPPPPKPSRGEGGGGTMLCLRDLHSYVSVG